jgi:hypothetical protein
MTEMHDQKNLHDEQKRFIEASPPTSPNESNEISRMTDNSSPDRNFDRILRMNDSMPSSQFTSDRKITDSSRNTGNVSMSSIMSNDHFDTLVRRKTVQLENERSNQKPVNDRNFIV